MSWLLALIIGILLAGVFLMKKKKKIQETFHDFTDPRQFNCQSKCKESDWQRIYHLTEKLGTGYRIPPVELGQFQIIEYIETRERLAGIIGLLQNQKILGVDIEEHRKMSYNPFVCLIQIATVTGVYLIDAIKLRQHIKLLEPVFENPKIIKVFHSCSADLQWLKRDFGIFCVNVFDTLEGAKCIGMGQIGLNILWHEFCNFNMDAQEKKAMQKSDWRLRPLTPSQLEYAARDAFYLPYLAYVFSQKCSNKQLHKIRNRTNNQTLIQPSIKSPDDNDAWKRLKKLSTQAITTQAKQAFYELYYLRDNAAAQQNASWNYMCSDSVLIELAFELPQNNKEISKICQELRQIPPLISTKKQEVLQICIEAKKIPCNFLEDGKTQTHITRQEHKLRRFKYFRDKFSNTDGGVYENCILLDPQGDLLCYCNNKKLQWYVDRDLAEWVQKSPPQARLKFEPAGRGFDAELDKTFYQQEKVNQCVVCGVGEYLIRYHVIPLLYRHQFLEIYKNHRSHDVVLLCFMCHEKATGEADKLKRVLSEEYQVPLDEHGENYALKQDLQKIHRTAVSMKKHGTKMPENRFNELKQLILDVFADKPELVPTLESGAQQKFENTLTDSQIAWLATTEAHDQLLSVYSDINWKQATANLHGVKVMEKVSDISQFVKRWRKFFIDSMKPEYMPDGWSVDHLLNVKEDSQL